MLVGICGNAGSGKDTVADHLCKKHGFVKVALADPLKRICKDVFDFTDEQLWGPSENRNAEDKRYPRPGSCNPNTPGYVCLSARYALQTLGTEWGRNCYPPIWVEYAIRVHEKLQGGGYAYDQKRGLFTVSYLMNAAKEEHGYNTVDTALMSPKTNVVISDVRFKNEVAGIHKAGGVVFRITRPGADGGVGLAGHASEMEQKDIPDEVFDVVIRNLSTLEDLTTIVDVAMRTLQNKP
jgi:hypothetical protein